MKDESGMDAIAWAGDTPWHRLGQEMPELMNSAEAIVEARMDWKVRLEQNYIKIDDEYIEVPNTYSTVRGQQEGDGSVILSKNGKALTSRYTPWQNIDAFDFLDELINTNEATIEVCGALGEGEKIWILAKLPSYIRVSGEDHVMNYILITNSHDGTGSIKILPTPIRVVCQNTLNMALGSKAKMFIMRHTKNAKKKVDEARKILKLIDIRLGEWGVNAELMLDCRMSIQDMMEYWEDSMGMVRDDKGELSTRNKNVLEEIKKCREHPTNMVGNMDMTAWQAYNALTYYIDHINTLDNIGFTDKKKSESALLGNASDKKVKAWKEAVLMIQDNNS